jgi:hypothetical protein
MEQQPFLGGGGHKWIIDFRQRVLPIVGPEVWNSIFKWGFVRNPWDRFVSVYFRWPPTKERPGYFHDFVMGEFRDHGFDIPLMKRNEWHLHHHFLPQHYFLCDEEQEIAVDFVGRFETVNQDWATVCETIGVAPRKLPLVNVGDHKPYQEYYDPQTREIIAEYYADDIRIFGYEFE